MTSDWIRAAVIIESGLTWLPALSPTGRSAGKTKPENLNIVGTFPLAITGRLK